VKRKVKVSPAKKPPQEQGRSKNVFRKVDTKKLIRSCREAGLGIHKIEYDNGKVTIFPGAPDAKQQDELSTWMKDQHADSTQGA